MARFIYCSTERDHAQKFKGLPKASFVGRGLYSKDAGVPMEIPDRGGELCAPIVMPDTPEHVAPDGTLITSRTHRDELCKRKGWTPYERLTNRPRGLANRNYAKKVKMEVSEEAEEYMKNRKKRAFKKAGLNRAGEPLNP